MLCLADSALPGLQYFTSHPGQKAIDGIIIPLHVAGHLTALCVCVTVCVCVCVYIYIYIYIYIYNIVPLCKKLHPVLNYFNLVFYMLNTQISPTKNYRKMFYLEKPNSDMVQYNILSPIPGYFYYIMCVHRLSSNAFCTVNIVHTNHY